MNKIYHLMFLPLLLLSFCQLGNSVDPEANLTYEEKLYLHAQDWGLGQTITNYVSNM